MTDLFAPETAAAEDDAARHKLFFALRPEPPVAEQLVSLAERLRRRHGLAGRTIPAERLHISLNGLGRHLEPPSDLIEMASRAMNGLRWPSFVVALDRCGSWGRGSGRRPLVMWADDGLIGACRLHEAIHERLAAGGVVRGRPRAFNPHLTLLRDETTVAERPAGPFAWPIPEFVLLDSIHGEARHEVLARWPLAARPSA